MKTHKQELLDLASDFKKADTVSLEIVNDDRAPANRVELPKKYVEWIIKALKDSAGKESV